MYLPYCHSSQVQQRYQLDEPAPFLAAKIRLRQMLVERLQLSNSVAMRMVRMTVAILCRIRCLEVCKGSGTICAGV